MHRAAKLCVCVCVCNLCVCVIYYLILVTKGQIRVCVCVCVCVCVACVVPRTYDTRPTHSLHLEQRAPKHGTFRAHTHNTQRARALAHCTHKSVCATRAAQTAQLEKSSAKSGRPFLDGQTSLFEVPKRVSDPGQNFWRVTIYALFLHVFSDLLIVSAAERK